MKLDLGKDIAKIRRYIEKRIQDYTVSENQGPGDPSDPVKMIHIGYTVQHHGWFAMVLDTRPDAESDGEWTMFIEDKANVVSFPQWRKVFEHLCDGGSASVSLSGGKTHTLDDNDDNESVAKFFGETLRELMLALRDDGTLAKLPHSKGALMVIEEFDGQYGWPPYKEQIKLGSID